MRRKTVIWKRRKILQKLSKYEGKGSLWRRRKKRGMKRGKRRNKKTMKCMRRRRRKRRNRGRRRKRNMTMENRQGDRGKGREGGGGISGHIILIITNSTSLSGRKVR